MFNKGNTVTVIEERVVPIQDAIPLLDLMMRVKMPEATVTEYVAAMKAGSKFPPIDCAEVEGHGALVTDGFVRHEAYRRINIAEITIRVRKVETLDEAIELAVRAGAHEGLARSNRDKQRAVDALLATDRGKAMSNVEVAQAAGVDESYVRKLRKASERIGQTDSVIDYRVNSRGERRPTKYKPRQKKRPDTPRPKGPLFPVISKANWPTAEETGRPSDAEWSLPHPDQPNYTRGEVFTREHGYVQTVSLGKKREQEAQLAMYEIIPRVREVAIACKPLRTAIERSKVNVVTLAATVRASALMMRKLDQSREDVLAVLGFLQTLLEALPPAPPAGDKEATGG